MPELIDKQETLKKIETLCKAYLLHEPAGMGGMSAIRLCKEIVEEQPTIEPEVRHGWWENGKCTNCKRNLLDLCGGEDYELARYAEFDADFCPFCGARMGAGFEDE